MTAFPKPPRRKRDVPYMLWVKRRPCFAGTLDPGGCRGPVEAAHTGPRGMGRKADDESCIPLCSGHHHGLHSLSGCFRGWDRERRRVFEAAARLHTRLAYEQRGDVPR